MPIDLKEFFIHELKADAPGTGPAFKAVKTDPAAAGAPQAAFSVPTEQAVPVDEGTFMKFQESLKMHVPAGGGDELTSMATELDGQAQEKFGTLAAGEPQTTFLTKYAADALKWGKSAAGYAEQQKKLEDLKNKLAQAGGELATA